MFDTRVVVGVVVGSVGLIWLDPDTGGFGLAKGIGTKSLLSSPVRVLIVFGTVCAGTVLSSYISSKLHTLSSSSSLLSLLFLFSW